MNKRSLTFGILIIVFFAALFFVAIIMDHRAMDGNDYEYANPRSCYDFLKKEMHGYENQSLSRISRLDFSYRGHLTGNEFQNLEALKDFHQIESLDCSHSKLLSDDFSICLQWLPHLKYLNLRETQVTEKSVPEIARLRELESLSLTRAYSGHVSPKTWDMSTPFTDKTLELLKECRSLDFLLIGDPCTITDEGLRQLEKFENLSELIIISSNITPEGFEYLKTLSWIRRIRIFPSAKDAAPPAKTDVMVHRDGDRYVSYRYICPEPVPLQENANQPTGEH